MKAKVNKPKFVNEYFSLDDKIKFLQSFDLINLQKAAKIGNIPSSKLKTRRNAIKSILAFDLKNKFLICQNIYDNLSEYYKKKIDDVYTFKTIEWNMYEFDHMKSKEWELIKDDLQKEHKIFLNQVNINAQNITIPLNNLQEPDAEITFSSLGFSDTKTNKIKKLTNIEDITNISNTKEKIIADATEIKTTNKTKKTNNKISTNKKQKNKIKTELNFKTLDFDTNKSNETKVLHSINKEHSNVSTLDTKLKKARKVSKNKIDNKKDNIIDDENKIINTKKQIFEIENSLNKSLNSNNETEHLNIKREIQNIDSSIECKYIKEHMLNNLEKLNQINQEILDIKSNLHNINVDLANFFSLNKLAIIEKNLISNQKILNYLEENVGKITIQQENLLNSNKKYQDQAENILHNDFLKLSSNIESYNSMFKQIMNDNKNILNSLSNLVNQPKKYAFSVEDKILNNIKEMQDIKHMMKNNSTNELKNPILNQHTCCARYKIKTTNTTKINDELMIQEQKRHKNNLEQLWKQYEKITSSKHFEKKDNEIKTDFTNNKCVNKLLFNTLEKLKNLKNQNSKLFEENNKLKLQHYNKNIFNVKVIKKVLSTISIK